MQRVAVGAVALLLVAAVPAIAGTPTATLRAVAAAPAGLYVGGAGLASFPGGRFVPLAPRAIGPAALAPDGRRLVYEVPRVVRVGHVLAGSASLSIRNLATNKDVGLIAGGFRPIFRGDGSLVYLHATFRSGNGHISFQPMERRTLASRPAALAPPLETDEPLTAASNGQVLEEVPTSRTRMHVVVLQLHAKPRRLLAGVPQSGVVAAAPNGTRALLWFTYGHDYGLALVRVGDGRVLARLDTRIPQRGDAGFGAWVGTHGVAVFGNQIAAVTIRGLRIRLTTHFALPAVEGVSVSPAEILYQDAGGRAIVFSADLEPANAGGAVDFNLFACDLGLARCTRTMAPRGLQRGEAISLVRRAGTTVVATR